MSNLQFANKNQLRQYDISGFLNSEAVFAFILDSRSMFVWINNISGLDNNDDLLIPASNPAMGRWASLKTMPITHDHVWDNISKDGSTLADLTDRSATDLNKGTLEVERLPSEALVLSEKPPQTLVAISIDGNLVPIKLDKNYIARDASIPWDAIDFRSITPNMLGENVESRITFDEESFDRNNNRVTLGAATETKLGGVRPSEGLKIDENGRLTARFGTGESEVLEGNAPLGGDLEGEHGAAVVSRIRNIPVAFFVNEVADKDKCVLTLDSSNPENPFFYLAPSSGGNIAPTYSVTSFTSVTNNLEVGQQIVRPVFHASFDGGPGIINLVDSQNLILTPVTEVAIVSPYSFKLNTAGSVTFTLKAIFNDTINKERSVSINWLNRIMYGTLPLMTSGILPLLQNYKIANSFNGIYSFNSSDYIYFAIPSSLGTPSFSVGGFFGGFQLVQDSVSIVNQFGVAINYNVWRSDNKNLGIINVSLS